MTSGTWDNAVSSLQLATAHLQDNEEQTVYGTKHFLGLCDIYAHQLIYPH